MEAYIGINHINVVFNSIFMHNPIRFLAMWGSAFVENKSLPHPYSPTVAVYNLIATGSFPKPSSSCTISASPGGIFLVFVAEEVPIILRSGSYFAFLCKKTNSNEHRKASLQGE